MLYTVNFDKHNKIHYRRPSKTLFANRSVVEIGYNTVPCGKKQILKRDVYIIHYVVSGRGKFMNNPFSKGQCYFVSAGALEIIEAPADESYESYWIMLEGQNAKDCLQNCGFAKCNSIFDFEYTEECSRKIHKFLFDTEYESELQEACKMEELMYNILSFHTRKLTEPGTKDKIDIKVQAVADYIENNYNSHIKISDLCHVFYFSKNYLCTIFKDKFGMTPKEYLINYRLTKAKILLTDKNCNMSVAEVSYAVGIDNPLYFSRLFHRKEGVSPTDYRNKSKHS